MLRVLTTFFTGMALWLILSFRAKTALSRCTLRENNTIKKFTSIFFHVDLDFFFSMFCYYFLKKKLFAHSNQHLLDQLNCVAPKDFTCCSHSIKMVLEIIKTRKLYWTKFAYKNNFLFHPKITFSIWFKRTHKRTKVVFLTDSTWIHVTNCVVKKYS